MSIMTTATRFIHNLTSPLVRNCSIVTRICNLIEMIPNQQVLTAVATNIPTH